MLVIMWKKTNNLRSLMSKQNKKYSTLSYKHKQKTVNIKQITLNKYLITQLHSYLFCFFTLSLFFVIIIILIIISIIIILLLATKRICVFHNQTNRVICHQHHSRTIIMTNIPTGAEYGKHLTTLTQLQAITFFLMCTKDEVIVEVIEKRVDGLRAKQNHTTPTWVVAKAKVVQLGLILRRIGSADIHANLSILLHGFTFTIRYLKEGE